MKVELHINGSLNILLTPETDIEKAILGEMAKGTSKGKVVKMSMDPDTLVVTVSVDK